MTKAVPKKIKQDSGLTFPEELIASDLLDREYPTPLGGKQ